MKNNSIRTLSKVKDPIDLLPGNGVRDGDLPLVVVAVAGHHLWRVAPELVVAEDPAGVKHMRRRLGLRI